MKHKGIKQIVSMLLAVVMLLSLMPATTLTAFAEELETINSVSLSGLSMPVVGERISSVSGSALSESQYGKYEYAVLDNQYADWRDEEGRLIEYGLQVFEAGRTYSISFSVEPKDGYAFTDSNIPVYMTNLYDYQYTGSITLSQETENATVTYTFELAGERTYADISEFRFYNVTAPSDGDQAHYNNGVWAYNNSEMTDRYWADSEGNRLDSSTVFEGGYSYSYNYEFTAFDGYKFADNVSIRNDTVVVDWGYSFNADNTKIYITIPYYIESSAVIDSVTVADMFLPTQGGSTRDFDSNVYQHAPSGANYTIPNQTNGWYETTAEYSSETQYEVSEESFIAGKQYKTFLILHANDNYKFASPENVSFAFSGISESNYSYVITAGGSESIIIVAITFTAQFPAGMGTISNPVVCSNFEELKYALQHPTVKGIVVNSFENSINQSFYTLQKEKDFRAGDCAITIPANTTKYLTINAEINIRVPYVDFLLYSFINNYGSLTVGGTGSINVSMNARGYPSAIILNNGELEIGGSVTFDPTNRSFDSMHGYSVINAMGSTVINSGKFYGYATNAVSYQRGSMDIYGGEFRIKNGDDQSFGLNADTYLTVDEHNVNLYGGTFFGIRADQSEGSDVPKLADLLGDGAYYTYYTDGAEFDPSGKIDTYETLVVKMYNVITDVELTIDLPKQNGKPDQSVTVGGNGYKQALAGTNMFDAPLQWQESTDGKNWTIMDLNSTFELGRYYRVFIDVLALKGYVFDTDSQFEPTVSASVNGYLANVVRYPEEEPEELVCVTYNFGQLNDSIIEQIDIEGIIEPVYGEHPVYNCGIAGTGYTVNKAYDNGTYAQNGISWYDVTFDKWVKPADTFMVGHEYKVFVDVKTESGYEFYTTVVGGSYKPAGWGYINGNYATLGIQSDARFEQSLSWTFDCEPATVKSVEISGIDVPVDGNAPDFNAVTNSKLYTIESIEWYDATNGKDMTDQDKFVEGNEYWLTVNIIPCESDGEELCNFLTQDKTVAYLNGMQVKKGGTWRGVTSVIRAVIIKYSYTAYAPGALHTVSGKITSSGDENATITVELIPDGETEAFFIAYAKGNSASYSFENIPQGDYAIRITKAGHPETVGNMTVSDSDVVYNVTLREYKFGQTVQIRLIEPWGLKANVRVHDGVVEHVDYSTLYDYGVYFIRASELGVSDPTQDNVSVSDIVGDSDAVHLNKANGVTVNSTVLTATYDKGLYTYEFSDSVFVLFYIVPYEGAERIYAPIRERNLSELVNARKDDTDDFGPEERAVYVQMALLEDHILDYRSDFGDVEKEPAFNVPTLATNPLSGTKASSSGYKFGHTVQIKLIEPWGMKINARVYTSGMTSSESIDYNTLQDYGCIVVQSDTKLTTVDEMLAIGDAYHFSKTNGYCDVAGNVITAKFYKDIYTYQLDHKLYVVFYVKDANGYHFGDVKERVLLDLMNTRKDIDNGDYTVKERLVYADMVNLYDAVWAYRDSLPTAE